MQAIETCRFGLGAKIRSLEGEDSSLFYEVRKHVNLPAFLEHSSIVFLTPSIINHPITQNLDYCDRGFHHFRSFNIPLEGDFSLVVKGGDLIDANTVGKMAERLVNKQIPCGCHESDNQAEFDGALWLQRIAMEKLGRLTYAPYPLDVRTISEVPVNDQFINLKEFLNSINYLDLNSDSKKRRLARMIGVSGAGGLGNLMLDQWSLLPTQYLYVVPGRNLRSNEIASLLFDNSVTGQFSRDPLFYLTNASLRPEGEMFRIKGLDYADQLRTIYSTLGKAYGLSEEEMAAVVPETISPDEYAAVIREISVKCDSSGIADEIIDGFINRVTEVAALAHSQGISFSRYSCLGGSLTSRNITYAGIVLDLDCMRPVNNRQTGRIMKDFSEMLTGVACLSRMVTMKRGVELLEKVLNSYISHFNNFCEDRIWQSSVRKALMRHPLNRHVMKCLEYK